MEDLRAHPQRLSEAGRSYRHDHKFLNVHIVVGMLAAIQNIHHWYRKHFSVHTTDILEKRYAQRIRRSARCRQRNTEDRVRAELPFVGRSVEPDQCFIQRRLVKRIHARDFIGDDFVDIFHCLQNPFAEVSGIITIPKFHCFKRACGCTGRNDCSAHAAIVKQHIYLYGRIAS